jgi:hypothetical protein
MVRRHLAKSSIVNQAQDGEAMPVDQEFSRVGHPPPSIGKRRPSSLVVLQAMMAPVRDQDRSRPSATTIRTGPHLYRCFKISSSGTTGSTGLIAIVSHLPPVSSPRLCHRDGKGESRNISTAWNFTSGRLPPRPRLRVLCFGPTD